MLGREAVDDLEDLPAVIGVDEIRAFGEDALDDRPARQASREISVEQSGHRFEQRAILADRGDARVGIVLRLRAEFARDEFGIGR